MPRDADSGSIGSSADKDGKDPADNHYTIGRLVGLLQEEFPDLSISKVRYLEDRRLIQPERTEGGYRRYGGSDLRRLRTILRLQRDEYLPLEVIKARLERGTAATTSRPLGPTQDSREPGALRQPAESLSWHEVK
ncbi:MAG TPA: MerR family transcriptional regulator, partial [Thermoleophilia bacterium]|nr:MerR family transcriptional regulator [Thermoleophilia bacterium]